MFLIKVNFSLFRAKAVTTESLLYTSVKYYNRKIDTVAKRGSMLLEFIANKDKRKKWHFNIQSDKPKARNFEKLHKPHRRKAVLSSLFIQNITDVISTGDILPEISQYGVQITGLKISPCGKILNIFWQVPVSQFDSCADIEKILTNSAPKLRAELISRNVLGRVPFIFFLRDSTNAKVSAFEKAIENLDLGPKSDSTIVVDDSFVENIFSFKSAQIQKKKTEVILDKQELTESNENDTESNENGTESNENVTKSNENDIKVEYKALPEKPVDMKSDIFGLNHDTMMEKVIALRKKKKGPPIKTALITPESLKDGDLFDKIPGIRFEADTSSRDDVLKIFHVQRKMLMKKKKEMSCNNSNLHYEDIEDDTEVDTYEEDFIDDEATDNSNH